MATQAVLIPGDGIGPAISDAVTEILDAAGADITWETWQVGPAALEAGEDLLPEPAIEAIRRCSVALKGPVTTPVGKGFASINVRLRKVLDLYANVRPARSLPGVESRYQGVDLVVVRENTEGLYSGIEHEVVPGVVESLKVMTERACTRICRYAFEHAATHGRKRVTAVHKANIMKMADGLFLRCFDRVATEYPSITADRCIVDAAAMKLVLDPGQFDVVVMENLYGDILSDLCAGLIGGLGVSPGANIGQQVAVFEAVHGSAPDIAGQNIANPTALLLSALLMLRHLGKDEVAERILGAVQRCLADGKKTRDLGGQETTTSYAEAIIERL